MNNELPDFLVRDEMHTREPIQAWDRFKRAVLRLVPGTPEDTLVLVLGRASAPKNVIDARPDGRCAACGEVCWICPSLRPYLETAVQICLTCLRQAYAAED